MAPVDVNTLLAALISPPEGGSELFGSDVSRYFFQLLLEGAVVQGDTRQLVLAMPKQEKSGGARSGK